MSLNTTDVKQCQQEGFPDLQFRINMAKLYCNSSQDVLKLVLNALLMILT